MRTVILVALLFLIIACANDYKASTSHSRNAVIVNNQIDSVKWLYYAYTHNSKVLFEKNSRQYDFNPTECDVNVEEVSNSNDTLIYKLVFSKVGFNYIHIYDGLIVYGFMNVKGAFVPLTGMVNLDRFDNLDFVREDNKDTDSIFTTFIKKTDPSKLSNWLQGEAKRRNVL